MTGQGKSKQSNERPELFVLNQRVLPYLQRLGFTYIESDVGVYLGTRLVATDAVVYLDESKREPYIVIQVKHTVRSQPSLLDPSVQQAFTAAIALGDSVRYLLITDGEKHFWFERIPESQSLITLEYAPELKLQSHQPLMFDDLLIPVIDPVQYHLLLQSVIDVLRKEGLSFGIRMAIELNRVIISKIYDEYQHRTNENDEYRFNARENDPQIVSHRVKMLYQDAVFLVSKKTMEEGIWSLSPRALLSAVKILEPYSISGVSQDVINRTFWTMFPSLLKREEGAFTTPWPLATLIAQLAHPNIGEQIIDPACGTGLLLLEIVKFAKSQFFETNNDRIINEWAVSDIVGVEINSEVAELASTNFIINGLSYTNIVNADALDTRSIEKSGILRNSYDVVVSNPPFGSYLNRGEKYIYEYYLSNITSKINIETLFLERSVDLLRKGGRLVILIPDSFLSSPQLAQARSWLLENTTNRAIISLPPETFAMAGHSGKASILLLEKRQPLSLQEPVLIADIKNIGYDRFGQPMRENDIPRLIEVVREFQETGNISLSLDPKGMRVWSVPVGRLKSERLDVSQLDPEGDQLVNALNYGRYPTVKIEEIAEIISGRNFKVYIKQEPGTAVVIQAGAVREMEINLSLAQYISQDDYVAAGRVKLQIGDVLVTTTGQYLGRAAVIEALPEAAVTSGAVTILRPKSDIDPVFLAAVTNSAIGKEQIYRRQAAATAQPYIRRSDLGQVIIPLPPLPVQRELAYRLTSMIEEVRNLQRRAIEIEENARKLIVSELLGTANNE